MVGAAPLAFLHIKTVYFIVLLLGLGALMLIGGLVARFDGIWKVMAFNSFVLVMLLVNAADRRREFRQHQLSKVRLVGYAFCIFTYWISVFRTPDVFGGVPGINCTAAGVQSMYPVNYTPAAPQRVMFFTSCDPGWAEMVNYGGMEAGTKCCVELPSTYDIDCSSGVGLVPDVSQDKNLLLASASRDMFDACCPTLMGSIVPPGFSTMAFSALFGILGNILFNLIKLTPIWTAAQRLLRHIRRSAACQAVVRALTVMRDAVAAAIVAVVAVLRPSPQERRRSVEQVDDEVDGQSDSTGIVDPDLDSTTSGDEMEDNEIEEAEAPTGPGVRPDLSLAQEAATFTAELTAEETAFGNKVSDGDTAAATAIPQSCEYAFDRSLRSMIGIATILASPCGRLFCVSGLHNDGQRNIGVYHLASFKERARPSALFSFADSMCLPNACDGCVSPDGRFLGVIQSNRQEWSLYSADEGLELATTPLTTRAATDAASEWITSLYFADCSRHGAGNDDVVAAVFGVVGNRIVKWLVRETREREAEVEALHSAVANVMQSLNVAFALEDAATEGQGAANDACGDSANFAVAVEQELDLPGVVEVFCVWGEVAVLTYALPHPKGRGSVTATITLFPQMSVGSTIAALDKLNVKDLAVPQFHAATTSVVPTAASLEARVDLADNACAPSADDPDTRADDDTPAVVPGRKRFFAYHGESGDVGLFSLDDAQCDPEHGTDLVEARHVSAALEQTTCIAVDSKGTMVACGRRNGTVVVLLPDGETREYAIHSAAVSSVCFIDSAHFVSSAFDGLLALVAIHAAEGQHHSELTPGVGYLRMALFPNGYRLLCVSEAGEVHIHNVGAMMTKAATFASVPLAISALREDGTCVVAALNAVDELRVNAVGLSDGLVTPLFIGYLPCRSMHLNPSGSVLVVLDRDGALSWYSLHGTHSGGAVAKGPRTLKLDRLIDRKRGPFTAMACVHPPRSETSGMSPEATAATTGQSQTGTTKREANAYALRLPQPPASRSREVPHDDDQSPEIITVGVEKRGLSYRLHLITLSIPNTAPTPAKRKILTKSTPQIDLSQDFFVADGDETSTAKVDIPLAGVALTEDATKICLWIGTDVFVCDIDAARRSIRVHNVLQPSPILQQEKVFSSVIRLKAAGGVLLVDHSHQGRVLRLIEHDQHYFVEEWHNVFADREMGVWQVKTHARVVRFGARIDAAAPTRAASIVATANAPDDEHRQPSAPEDARDLPTDTVLHNYTAAPLSTTPSTTPRISTSVKYEKCEPIRLEVYGYPKSQDPMKHKIRAVMNVILPLLRTDELSRSSISAVLLPRGEGVITSAMAGTAYWPRQRAGTKNLTYGVSKFVVHMFQPSEFLLVKALIATVLGVALGIKQVVDSGDSAELSSWNRFALFCATLTNGPLYSSVIDPISALTVHLHLQRSGLFPIAGNAATTESTLYADRNSFHQAYLTVGGLIFFTSLIFWVGGFVAAVPFMGSLLLLCAAVNGGVRALIHSPLIAVSNATTNASCDRQALAWIRHVALFALCLADNIMINFFLQVVLRFPVNTGILLFGDSPYLSSYPYTRTFVTTQINGNATLFTASDSTLGALPYFSNAGAATAHAPLYVLQVSSASCNAIKLASTVFRQINEIMLFL